MVALPSGEQDPVVLVRRAALGSRLEGLRRGKGLSQEDLARRAGVDRSFYSEVVAGDHSPTVDWLYKVAGALGVHIRDLFEEAA